MGRQVLLSREAASNLRHIKAWYRQQGAGSAARAKLARILAGVARLVESPCSYRRIEGSETRQLLVEGHRVVFRILPDANNGSSAGDVFIVSVAGPGQANMES